MTSNDQQENKKKHTLAEAFAFVLTLNKDAAELYGMSKGSPTMRRAAARAVFAAIEGLAHVLRQLAISVALDNHRLADAIAMSETTFTIDGSGKLKQTRRDIRLETNLKCSCRILGELRAPSFKLDLGGKGWQALLKGIEVRNRVTHPKAPADIEISDPEMRALWEAAMWMTEQLGQLGEAFTAYERAHGDVLQRRLGVFENNVIGGEPLKSERRDPEA